MFENWKKRHQDKTSFILHMIGIPLAILAIPALIVGIVVDSWAWVGLAIGLVVVGYVLQFIGHRIEGNDVGEIILVKKLLGKPYIAVAKKHKQNSKS